MTAVLEVNRVFVTDQDWYFLPAKPLNKWSLMPITLHIQGPVSSPPHPSAWGSMVAGWVALLPHSKDPRTEQNRFWGSPYVCVGLNESYLVKLFKSRPSESILNRKYQSKKWIHYKPCLTWQPPAHTDALPPPPHPGFKISLPLLISFPKHLCTLFDFYS